MTRSTTGCFAQLKQHKKTLIALIFCPALMFTHSAFAAECNGRTAIKVSSGTYTGTSGSDVVLVTGNNVTLNMKGGDDHVCVSDAYNTKVDLGSGNDYFLGASGVSPDNDNNKIYGDAGKDDILGAFL